MGMRDFLKAKNIIRVADVERDENKFVVHVKAPWKATITADNNQVTISHTGAVRSFVGEKKTTTFVYDNITGINVVPVSLMQITDTNGYIEFIVPGVQPVTERKNLEKHPNVVSIWSAEDEQILNDLKTFIESKQHHSTPTTQEVSSMDELKKLAELRDLGIVTDEEFETKKKELLGL